MGKLPSPLPGKPPPSRTAARTRSRARARLSGGAFTLSALLMIGAERVIIDEVEDDNAHFMAEYIDPA
ncbi:MAG: hypothetical protein ABW069_17645 [Duganella sp.]